MRFLALFLLFNSLLFQEEDDNLAIYVSDSLLAQAMFNIPLLLKKYIGY